MKAYQVVPTLNGVGRTFDLCVRVGGVVYDISAGDFDYDQEGEPVFMLTIPADQEPNRPSLADGIGTGSAGSNVGRGLTQRAFNMLALRLRLLDGIPNRERYL